MSESEGLNLFKRMLDNILKSCTAPLPPEDDPDFIAGQLEAIDIMLIEMEKVRAQLVNNRMELQGKLKLQ
jgi:hypothetical protein